VLKAAQLATDRREACLRQGRSLAFETAFSAPDKVDFVRRGIAAGFFVRLFFVGTDERETFRFSLLPLSSLSSRLPASL
jgi:predicted ABC-type ATPase